MRDVTKETLAIDRYYGRIISLGHECGDVVVCDRAAHTEADLIAAAPEMYRLLQAIMVDKDSRLSMRRLQEIDAPIPRADGSHE